MDSFEQLQYPKGWLLSRVATARTLVSRDATQTPTQDTCTPKSRVTVPTSTAAEHLTSVMKRTDSHLVLTSSTRIRDIVTKTALGPHNDLSVVYSIPCGGCDRTYIGETGRGLDKRLKEHQTDMRNMTTSNAMVQHTLTTGHRPHWTHAEVLHQGMDRRTRKALEAAEILNRDTTNTKTGCTLWAPQTARLMAQDWLPRRQ